MERLVKQRDFHFFIPLYFDLPSFLLLRDRILERLPQGCSARFHLLDDTAGGDPSLRDLNLPDVLVLPMPFNLGHQRALVYGLRLFLREDRGDAVVVTMDADGEDRPEDLPTLFDEFFRNESARPLVLARRTYRKEDLLFKFFYLVYKFIFRMLTGTLIQTGNFAVMHSKAIARIIYHPYFDLAYASTLLSIGTNLRFVPCPRGARYEGRSKMNFSRLAIHGVRMLMPFMDRIAIRGVVAFFVFFFLSLLSCFLLGFLCLFFGGAVPNWLLLLAAIAFVTSFLSICNFAILITVFANIQAVALSRLEFVARSEK